MFDRAGALLYVGISYNAAARASAHRTQQPWWEQVATITVEHTGLDRADVEELERRAILAERPRYNRTHARPICRPPRLTPTKRGCWRRFADPAYMDMPCPCCGAETGRYTYAFDGYHWDAPGKPGGLAEGRFACRDCGREWVAQSFSVTEFAKYGVVVDRPGHPDLQAVYGRVIELHWADVPVDRWPDHLRRFASPDRSTQ